MANNTYQHWDGQGERGTVVVRTDEENEVHIPKSIKPALENHKYGPTVNQAGVQANRYYKVPYERSENEYPKMLFHPDFHKEPEPNRNHFKETHEWEQAMRKWDLNFNRVQTAHGPEAEEQLIEAGWLPKPPEIKTTASFDKNSIELYPNKKK